MELFNPQLFSNQLFIQKQSDIKSCYFQTCHDYLLGLIDQQSPQLHQSHFIQDRFENIEITSPDNSALALIIEDCLSTAAQILNIQSTKLSIKYWFNLMPPGGKTGWHSHDDFNELLSGVLYLQVPENSGDLILESNTEKRLTPYQGLYVFFDPATRHAVSENLSSQNRLSIGMNFGRK